MIATHWSSTDVPPVSATTLRQLIANEVPAVRHVAFASPSETAAFGSAMLEGARRSSSVKQVTRLGISQYEQGIRGSKQQYFDAAREAREEYATIFAASFDPLSRFIDLLCGLGFRAGLMEEPGWGPYFAGTGKVRNGESPIHVDFSPQDSAGWAVGTLRAQLAWNYYINVPDTGSELLLWDKLWQPEHDVHQSADSYWYHPSVVEGAIALRIPVSAGDVVILNSRNYHAVASSTDRLAYGSFIACHEGDRLGLFS
jgi:hypothetical protein